MTEVVEETEPESSFKETDRKKKIKFGGPNARDVPTTVPEESNYEDRDDDISSESENEQLKSEKNELKDFTFIPGNGKNNDHKGHTFMAKSMVSNDVDMSKLSSVERIREYLESELGIELLKQIHPIIKS